MAAAATATTVSPAPETSWTSAPRPGSGGLDAVHQAHAVLARVTSTALKRCRVRSASAAAPGRLRVDLQARRGPQLRPVRWYQVAPA
jgi:hypothetical protein